jgi:D-alanine-D-alanine ligase
VLGSDALPIVEAIPRDADLYDFEARYEIGRTDFVCPAELEDDAEAAVNEAALRAFETLGCSGFARVDLMLGDAGPEVLEVNAVPGLTDTSLLPQAAEAAGIGFDELVEQVLALAIERQPNPAASR